MGKVIGRNGEKRRDMPSKLDLLVLFLSTLAMVAILACEVMFDLDSLLSVALWLALSAFLFLSSVFGGWSVLSKKGAAQTRWWLERAFAVLMPVLGLLVGGAGICFFLVKMLQVLKLRAML
ncbi:MAG: hypothetical protein ACOX5J_08490 [Candidatus Hydrogenedentales bacterium]|jgi:hypothetical protein